MLEQIPIIRGVVDLANDGGPWVPVIFSSGVLMWALIIESPLTRRAQMRSRWDQRSPKRAGLMSMLSSGTCSVIAGRPAGMVP